MAKRPTAEQKQMYDEFRQEFDYCMACGWQQHIWREWHIQRLECAHIVGGPGRRHDRRAIVRLCEGCHRLAHMYRIRPRGEYLPNLTRDNLVWLKSIYDPEYLDLEYLNELCISCIGEPEPPDDWFHREFAVIGPTSLRKFRSELVTP